MGTEKFKPFAKVQKVLLVDDFKLILSGTLQGTAKYQHFSLQIFLGAVFEE